MKVRSAEAVARLVGRAHTLSEDGWDDVARAYRLLECDSSPIAEAMSAMRHRPQAVESIRRETMRADDTWCNQLGRPADEGDAQRAFRSAYVAVALQRDLGARAETMARPMMSVLHATLNDLAAQRSLAVSTTSLR